MTATNPQPPDRCPACGKDNRCEMARGKSQCWCFEMSVSPNVINNLSEEDVGVACLCSNCASGVTPSPCVRECELDPVTQICRVVCAPCRRSRDGAAAERTRGVTYSDEFKSGESPSMTTL